MDVIDGCLRNELTRRGTSVPVMISSKGGRVWRGGRHLDMAPLQPLIDGNITQPPLSPYNAGYLYLFLKALIHRKQHESLRVCP